MSEGDSSFIGVNEFDTPENLMPGQCQSAVNIDFSAQTGATRGGFVCLPILAVQPFGEWVSRSSAANSVWLSVAYGNGVYVAVAESSANNVMYSSDGRSWTAISPNAQIWAAVTFGGGQFVAVGPSASSPYVMTSPDGITWTARTGAANYDWRGITYGNGLFVAVADSGAITGRVMTSADGVTWTLRSSSTSIGWRSVCYAGGLFVAVGSSGTGNRVMTSPDGITWTQRASASDTSQWNSVTYGNSVYVAVGDAAVMTSSDAITWVSQTPASANDWRSVAFGGGVFMAVSRSGAGDRAMSSTNGLNWTSRTTPADNDWYGVIYSDAGLGQFVAVSATGSGNRVMTCPAGSVVAASGVYSDPNDPGSRWVMLVGTNRVGFYAFGRSARSVSINSGYSVTEQSTVVQCNNQVYIFRGAGNPPLYWTGDWASEFTLAPAASPLPSGFTGPPSSNQATYYQNRLWVIDGKDSVAASDVLDFTAFDELAEEFNLNTGNSDYLVTTYPFGDATLVVFKNNSILALNSVDGSLADVTCTEITRTVGCVGINAVTTVGPDLVYASDRNINLLSLTTTNNSLQHKTLPLSRNIKTTFKRVNWEYGYKISLAFWDNKLFVALPLDNATACNAVVVYNFITEQWFGEWNFDSSIGMNIQGWAIATYLGEQRLHCITEDGRIFVTDEGPQDISGTTVADISTSLTTRAYRMNNENRIGRRMWADLATWRPQFSVTAHTDGVNEYSQILTDQTYSRSQSWIFGDSSYSLTNSGDNYNRAGRKDYAGYPSDSIQPQSGFLPEALQQYRLPLVTRRKGRLAWFTVDNTQGKIVIFGVGNEARTGDRGNLIQVI